MLKNILIFAYYSYKDPVFQSAVLPYFTEIKYSNTQFLLLTFEHDKYLYENRELEEIEQYLRSKSIIWYRLKWRSGKFKPIKKIYDLLSSLFFSFRLIKKNHIKAIYSEGFPGAILAHFVAKRIGLPHIVHTFEPHGEYMLEAGVWKESSWEYKLQKKLEKRVAKDACAILTATHAMAEKIKSWGTDAKIFRVPSCVDTSLFKQDDDLRNEIRSELQVTKNELLFVYLGKFGGMYMDDQFFKLIKQLQEYKDLSCKFLIISTDNRQFIENQIIKYNIDQSLVTVTSLIRIEVPKYLNAGDFGIVAVKPLPSKRYCSPIKDGEYWACGLPIIIPEGVSDDYLVAESLNIGIIWHSEENISRKIDKFRKVNDLKATKNKCYEYAKRDRSIKSFEKLYNDLFINLP